MKSNRYNHFLLLGLAGILLIVDAFYVTYSFFINKELFDLVGIIFVVVNSDSLK